MYYVTAEGKPGREKDHHSGFHVPMKPICQPEQKDKLWFTGDKLVLVIPGPKDRHKIAKETCSDGKHIDPFLGQAFSVHIESLVVTMMLTMMLWYSMMRLWRWRLLEEQQPSWLPRCLGCSGSQRPRQAPAMRPCWWSSWLELVVTMLVNLIHLLVTRSFTPSIRPILST